MTTLIILTLHGMGGDSNTPQIDDIPTPHLEIPGEVQAICHPDKAGFSATARGRAKARAVTAVLHSKSPSQLQEVITAALRRAGFCKPLSMPQQCRTQPNDPVLFQMMTMINSYMVAQTAAVNDLVMQLKKLDNRTQCWEEHYPAEVLDRLPHGAPPTPEETSDCDMVEKRGQ